MKKMINKPENIVTEMIGGMLKAFPDYLEQVGDLPVVKRKNKKEGKVALISGGGSGHEPSHAGFVGYGMLDAAVAGEVFTSPSADKVYEAIKAVDSGNGVLLIIKNYSGDVMNFEMAAEMAGMEGIDVKKIIVNDEAIKAVDSGNGVLLIIKNYSGDVMNFEMAAEMAGMEGIDVKKIIVNDDIAVENSTYTVGRRGIAGTVLVHKMVGAAAEKGYSLDDLEVLGNKVISRTKTMGMSLKPCMVPTTGKLSFELPEDEVEIGLGIHGEPGTQNKVISRTKTMGMSLKPCMVPTTGKLSFELPEDEVEIGLGIHGEPGTHREKMQDANAHVDYLLDKILKESELSENDEVAVLVNGLGETTLIELYIINNRVSEVLANKNIKVYDTIVGNYMTSLDMGGFSITLVKLDDEMKELLKAKADTPLANKNIKVYDTIVGNYMTSLDMGGFSITLVKLDDEMKELLKAKADTPAFKRF